MGPLYVGNPSDEMCERLEVHRSPRGDDEVPGEAGEDALDSWVVVDWHVAPQRGRRFSVWLVGQQAFPAMLLTSTNSTARAQFFLDVAEALPALETPVSKTLWHAAWRRAHAPTRMRPAAAVRTALNAFLRTNSMYLGSLLVVDHARDVVRDQSIANAVCTCASCGGPRGRGAARRSKGKA